MNRLIIAAGALLAINAVIVGVLFIHSGLGNIDFLERGRLLSDVSSATSQDASHSQSAVQATLQSKIAQGDETVLVGTPAIDGGYALQFWSEGDIAGEALLQYDTTQNQWSLVTWNGGTWDADELVQEGLPQDTASVLVADMSN